MTDAYRPDKGYWQEVGVLDKELFDAGDAGPDVVRGLRVRTNSWRGLHEATVADWYGARLLGRIGLTSRLVLYDASRPVLHDSGVGQLFAGTALQYRPALRLMAVRHVLYDPHGTAPPEIDPDMLDLEISTGLTMPDEDDYERLLAELRHGLESVREGDEPGGQ